jgi:hypothetical protein
MAIYKLIPPKDIEVMRLIWTKEQLEHQIQNDSQKEWAGLGDDENGDTDKYPEVSHFLWREIKGNTKKVPDFIVWNVQTCMDRALQLYGQEFYDYLYKKYNLEYLMSIDYHELSYKDVTKFWSEFKN